ncbi:MAG: RagB/SusD family nutrient uptake outer membrane protein [Bacteroidaceae bacterium]|nr:RagB/SusD family nutrient uptake outer membrane protein [Bacteroidaceae bacterium]
MNPNSIIKRIVSRGRVLSLLVAVAATPLFVTSCQDILDPSSNMVIKADVDHLSSARDSIYSVIGILNKMQGIADRTVLLGEARADLVDITASTSKDLREVALFSVGDDNKYNNPRDYYAIINNCNYFINNVDTAMKNNRNENVFLNEYAVVKAIRAWTYLQLVTTYGKVPFVVDPILSKDEGEKDYPMYDIQQICDYFIEKDGLQALADDENITYPYYGDIKGKPSRLFYIQLNLILGDLYLWRASITQSQPDYLMAAKRYYAYISKRNGTTTASAYPTTTSSVSWTSSNWTNASDGYSYLFHDDGNGKTSEIITMIPMDSIPSEGYYSEVRGIYNTAYNDNQVIGLVPSQAMKDISADQTFCYYDKESEKFLIAPKGLSKNRDGDLRLASVWSTNENFINNQGQRITAQGISKFTTTNGNLNIYRRGQVYLRFAEAINRAGFPRYAYQILASGVNTQVISNCITPFCDKTDSLTLSQFAFSESTYEVGTWRSDLGYYAIMYNGTTGSMAGNHIGIHSRGSGYSSFDDNYKMPYGTEAIDTIYDESGKPVYLKVNVEKTIPGLVEKQMEAVEEMIVNEQALETAFEGFRFYDLMRVALRRQDPSYLAKKVYARGGAQGVTGISADLTDTRNWFLRWNNQIGMY